VLKNKKATVYEDRETITELKKAGAIYEKTDVVVSGNVITAARPTASLSFAKGIALTVK
jgi:putative intracellular protease/amidase